VHMVRLKMPLFNPAFSLLGQLLEHFAQMLPKALVQHLRWSRLFGQVFRVFKWNNCSS